jgi:hypothetical protein
MNISHPCRACCQYIRMKDSDTLSVRTVLCFDMGIMHSVIHQFKYKAFHDLWTLLQEVIS